MRRREINGYGDRGKGTEKEKRGKNDTERRPEAQRTQEESTLSMKTETERKYANKREWESWR